MDKSRVRFEPTEYERDLPFAEDLFAVYEELGAIVTDRALQLEPNEDALAERLIATDPAFDPGTPVHESVRTALTARGEDEPTSAAEAGLEVATHIIDKSTNTRSLMVNYLSACFQVDQMKLGLRGYADGVKAEHAILESVRGAIIDEIPAEERSVRIINNVRHTLNHIVSKDDFFGWFMVKTAVLEQDLINRERAVGLASNMPAASAESMDALATNKVDVKRFVHETVSQRKYGVKAAYTEASVGGAWVYYDRDDVEETIGSDGISYDYVAMVVHSPHSSFESLKFSTEEIVYGNNGKFAVLGGAMEDIQPDLRMVVGNDGELYLDEALLMPVRHLLINQPGVYESFQAEIIANLYDLTASAGVETIERTPNFALLDKKEKKNYDPVLQLLLPRIKRKYSGEELDAEESSRTVREHGVIFFVRDLPAGYHASPEAIERALRHNIELEPHETFVRAHRRGKGNPVQGHSIVSNTQP